ncbi:hypothetical protein HII31_09576 [Pseudocercospora fuligena]|uniref:Zinc finger PHD-type domain-containing protein n=1 Tax=Pseudocercospora fuligena TaxID=685502 RepID=A0A8H6RDX2_9PEZI|nr:hypothetical protein HII31_09576 [Pseudocercospora fuligena]
MVNTLDTRDLGIKALFYREFAQSASRKPFLRRNLRHILDYHESELAKETTKETTTSAPSANGMSNEHKHCRRAKWQPPSNDTLEDLFEARRPQLRLTSLLIRHNASNSRTSRNVIARGRERKSQSWVPSPGEWKLPVFVGVSIHYKAHAKTEVYRDKVEAQIIRYSTSDRRPVFSVELKKPLLLGVEQLAVPRDVHASNSDAAWARTLTDRYTLEISVQPRNSKESAALLSQLENKSPSEYKHAPSNEGVIRLVWGDPNMNTTSKDPGLPELPLGDQLLMFRRVKGHKSLQLDYGAEVDMSWKGRTSGTVLADYNMRQARLERKRHMPTPAASEDQRPAKRRRGPSTIRYLFRSTTFVKRQIELENLSCIFCQDDREHTSFPQLLNHYQTHHDQFSIDVEDVEDEPDVKVMSLHLDDEQYNGSTEEESEDFDWEAPNALLDIAAHVDGDSTWKIKPAIPVQYQGMAPATKKFSSTSGPGRPPKRTLTAVKQQPNSATVPLLRKRDTAPEDVPDLTPRKRRKHRVPDVPGVSFYRTTSKKVLVAGDEVSDSDDDVDNTWIVQSQRHDLRKLGKDPIELQFHLMLNSHLDEEQPESDVLVRDALVRFARRHAQKLSRPKLRALFKSKLEQLESRGILTKAYLDYCMKVVPPAEKQATQKQKGADCSESSVHSPTQPRGADGRFAKAGEPEAEVHPSKARVHGLLQARGSDGRFSQESAEVASPAAPQSPSRAFSKVNDSSDRPRTAVSTVNLTPNSKFRARWIDGRIVKDADSQSQTFKPQAQSSIIPFGNRFVICKRAPKAKMTRQEARIYKVPVSDLLKDELETKPPDQIMPRDLEFLKLSRIMDKDLIFLRGSDNIVYISGSAHQLVTDEKDFYSAMEQAKKTPSHEEIVFELQETTYYVDLLQARPKSPEQDEAAKLSGKGKRNFCVCGKRAEGYRGTIGCGNSRCGRDFHMDCVKLLKRPMDWKCVDCSVQG